MKHYLRSIFVLGGFLVLWGSCASDQPDILLGNWAAIEVLEEGSPLDINTNTIKLGFREGSTYTYESTLNYKEAGRYYVEHQYLFTTDTTGPGQSEAKAVEIIHLTIDSLQLRMNDNGKERILKLIRQQQTPPSG